MTPMNEPVRPLRGLTVRGQMFVADLTGKISREITDAMLTATVTYKWDDLVPGQLNCTFRGQDVIQSISECLVPFLTVEWTDGYGVSHRVSERLGLFFFLPADRNINYSMDTSTVQAFDATWALSQLTLDQAWVMKPNTAFLGDWASTMIGGKTALNVFFPKTDSRPGKTTSYLPNANGLETVNSLYARAGYWPVVAIPNNAYGLITSPGRKGLLGTQEIAREIKSEELDVIGDVQMQPKREDFANQIYVSSNSSNADPTMRDGYKATLTDPNSEWSVQNLGYIISKQIEDNLDEDFDAMRRRALGLLEKTSSMNTRMIVPVWPDPRIVPYEVWNVNIRRANLSYVSQTRWRVEETTFGFTPDSAAQIVTLGRLASLIDVV